MVTVVKTPQGHKIIDQAIDASIVDGSGIALVVFPYHSLTTGDYVYITSDIDEYNGFWYVEVIDYQTFEIREHADSDVIEFYQEVDIEYYKTKPHDWSSIFLPIVYKINNDKWPTNTSDTARTVSSASDDNGFTHLTLSGDLRAVPVNMLEFIRITGASDSDLNNVWQIVEVISNSSVVISLPYASVNSFSGATIQYYYNNYQVRVKVFAGLNDSHPWTLKKPYEEMAELSLTPDDNNEVMFSVSDYIKSKVQVKNNLTLFSLPLNLDAFTAFFIQTAESYDYSDNYSLSTATSTFANDTFEGYAIAGKLPFKNTYSGDYSDYVYVDGAPARWLTNATRLLAVEDLYFDISFIKNIQGPFTVTINKYVGTDLNATEDISYSDQGIGVYRIPIVPNASFDSFCVSVATDDYTAEVEVPVPLEDLTDMTNEPAGGDLPDWTLGATPSIVGQSQSDNLSLAKVITLGSPFLINYKILIANKVPGFFTFVFESLTGAFASVEQVVVNANSDGIYQGSVTFPATGNANYITLTYSNGGAWDMTLLELSFGEPTTETVEVDGVTVTEEICIDILEQCEAQQGFTQEDARLLEDGDFRLLE